MRVTIVTSAFLHPDRTDMPGVRRYSTELVRALSLRGIQVRVVVPGADHDTREIEGNIEVQRIRSLRNLAGPIAGVGQVSLLSFGLRFAKSVDLSGDSDLVHSTIPLLQIDALRDQCPVVAFAHHVERVRRYSDLLTVPFGNAYGAYTYRRADAVVAPSEATARQLVQHSGIEPSKVQVIHHGVDTAVFFPENASTGAERRPSTRTILFVGPMTARKNVLLLVEALKQLIATLGDVRLVLVGRGPLDAQIDRAARSPALHGRIVRLARLSDDQLRDVYTSADAFVSPSLDEGFGFAAVEAMACGTPVVALNTPVNREIIGDAGVLVRDATATSLARAVRAVLCDTPRGREMAGLGRRYVEMRYNWSTAAERYERLYRRLIRTRGAS